MFSIEDVIKRYQQASDKELIEVSKSPEKLRKDLIPALQKELLSRGLQDEALSLTDFLAGDYNSLKNLSNKELRDHINERIANGESLESIKTNLAEYDINLLEMLDFEMQSKEKAIDYVNTLQNQDLDDAEIDQKLKENLNLRQEDIDTIKESAKSRNRRSTITGYVFLVFGMIFLFLGVATGAKIGIGSIVLIAVGIWKIYEGSKGKS